MNTQAGTGTGTGLRVAILYLGLLPLALPYGIEVMVSKMPLLGVHFGLARFGDTALWLRRTAAFV